MTTAVTKAMIRFHRKCHEINLQRSGHGKTLARLARDKHGVEWTPDQAASLLADAFADIRAAMVAKGHPEFATMETEQLRAVLHEAMG